MSRKKVTASRRQKRPYRAPVLKIHGDLKKLTMTKGGTRTDGGSPKTRNTGPP